MITSRNISDLLPDVACKVLSWQEACKLRGLDVVVYCTYRDDDAQNALYAQGRTKAGAVVTNAKGGYSAHQYRRAVDFAIAVNGKLSWELHHISAAGELAELHGLEWAGRWKSFKEYCHVQDLGGLTIEQLRDSVK